MDTKQRLIELLAERATVGLDGDDRQELEALLNAHPEWDNDSFDLAAAAIDEALATGPQALPASLHARLSEAGAQFVANASDSGRATESSSDADPTTPALATVHPIDGGRRSDAESTTPKSFPSWTGWVAAAAALLIAVLAWWPAVVPVPGAPGDASENRETMLAEVADVQEVSWQATADPAAVGASGDVVWSGTEQTGYMRIRGLATNDPGLSQYQLWIFDAQRDDRFPVDGGVFDIPEGVDEIVVPIAAKLPVYDPVLFAVTLEAPGGVVVSDRERIVLLAQESSGN